MRQLFRTTCNDVIFYFFDVTVTY